MTKVNTLTEEELWQWHAYDYAWRRVVLRNYQPVSPIDPAGAWYGQRLADAAERVYRPKWRPTKLLNCWDRGYADRYDEPWFRALDFETRQRYMRQDQEVLEMHNRVVDGTASDQDFVTLCCKLTIANLQNSPIFAGRSLDLHDVREALGVSAKTLEEPPAEGGR